MQISAHALERTITVSFAHRIYFTRTAFSPQNRLLAKILSPGKALVVVDREVARAFPKLLDQITAYFADDSCRAKLVGPALLVPGGEPVKNSRDLVDELYREIEHHRIDRHSYLIAIGGGALLDAAGFAAATAHRGVRLVRLPTTSLSQADGGVGVKNGINAFGKKNFIGTFAPPFAVINDSDFLEPLPPAEKRAGLIEAIKVALIRDAAFFAEIERLAGALGPVNPMLASATPTERKRVARGGDPGKGSNERPALKGRDKSCFAPSGLAPLSKRKPTASPWAAMSRPLGAKGILRPYSCEQAPAHFESTALETVIRRCAELHVAHIAGSGDPFELGSARPLDFGHWSAHKLEQMSGFSISHGAAVACGIALDVLYSHKSGMLSCSAAERILALIEKLGFCLFDPLMTQTGPDGSWLLLAGLQEFREHLGGELTVTLLRDIGLGEEVHAIDAALMRKSLLELAQRCRP